MLYVVNETYVTPEGISEHMKSAEKNWDKFPKLMVVMYITLLWCHNITSYTILLCPI